MTVLNFPASPNVNDTYTENGVIYTWNGTYWAANNAQDLDGRFVNVTGDTMTGNLTVPSLNGGQLAGMRNVLINGAVTINQRGVTYAAAAVGDYWADRWKKTAGGMTQIVEASNFAPSTQYTLSGTGVTTQQITSPASGDWTIPDVPSTATNIQLEPGPVATPFEHRSYGQELALCQRYYEQSDANQVWCGRVFTGVTYARLQVFYKVTKRSVPSVITITNVSRNGFPSTAPSTDGSGVGSVQINLLSNATVDDGYLNVNWQVSAEL